MAKKTRFLSKLKPQLRWWITGLYLASLYLSLPYTRSLVLSLRKIDLLSISITGCYLLVAVLLIYFIVFYYRVRDLAAYILISIVGIIFS